MIYNKIEQTKTGTPKIVDSVVFVAQLATIFATFHRKRCRGIRMGLITTWGGNQFMIQLNLNMRATPYHRMLSMGSLMKITIKNNMKGRFRVILHYTNMRGNPLVLTLRQNSYHRRNHRVFYILILTWKHYYYPGQKCKLGSILIKHEGIMSKNSCFTPL